MKSLLKLAVGAAIAGALVNMLMKQRSGMRQEDQDDEGAASGDGMGDFSSRPENAGTSGFTVGELVADTNTVNSGDASRDQRGQQPQEWRGAQNVLDS
jgi:hypothetical protein